MGDLAGRRVRNGPRSEDRGLKRQEDCRSDSQPYCTIILELPCCDAITAVSFYDTKIRPITPKPITGEELLSIIRLLASFPLTCYKDFHLAEENHGSDSQKLGEIRQS